MEGIVVEGKEKALLKDIIYIKETSSKSYIRILLMKIDDVVEFKI